MALNISFARSLDELHDLRPILTEYLEWDIAQLREASGIDISAFEYVENTFNEIDAYFPPHGGLLLARDNGILVGIGFLKKIRDEHCEIKRMYVLPSHRGTGLGKKILSTLIGEAKSIGYKTVLLDSAVYMKTAHALYRSMGFEDIEYYPEGETDEMLKDYLVYMELRL